ncbi:hypothetical protein B0H19DRAFT_1182850, partial [Mycena capillaripes]
MSWGTGKPETISGFQTHQTPVRLVTTERAELATELAREEFIPFGHVLESLVILQKKKNWMGEGEKDAMWCCHRSMSDVAEWNI